jgi:hypothetical protein
MVDTAALANVPGRNEVVRNTPHYEQLKANIAQNGIQRPIQVSRNGPTGQLSIFEGNHRLSIARELGLPQVPVQLVHDNGDGTVTPAAGRTVRGETAAPAAPAAPAKPLSKTAQAKQSRRDELHAAAAQAHGGADNVPAELRQQIDRFEFGHASAAVRAAEEARIEAMPPKERIRHKLRSLSQRDRDIVGEALGFDMTEDPWRQIGEPKTFAAIGAAYTNHTGKNIGQPMGEDGVRKVLAKVGLSERKINDFLEAISLDDGATGFTPTDTARADPEALAENADAMEQATAAAQSDESGPQLAEEVTAPGAADVAGLADSRQNEGGAPNLGMRIINPTIDEEYDEASGRVKKRLRATAKPSDSSTVVVQGTDKDSEGMGAREARDTAEANKILGAKGAGKVSVKLTAATEEEIAAKELAVREAHAAARATRKAGIEAKNAAEKEANRKAAEAQEALRLEKEKTERARAAEKAEGEVGNNRKMQSLQQRQMLRQVGEAWDTKANELVQEGVEGILLWDNLSESQQFQMLSIFEAGPSARRHIENFGVTVEDISSGHFRLMRTVDEMQQLFNERGLPATNVALASHKDIPVFVEAFARAIAAGWPLDKFERLYLADSPSRSAFTAAVTYTGTGYAMVVSREALAAPDATRTILHELAHIMDDVDARPLYSKAAVFKMGGMARNEATRLVKSAGFADWSWQAFAYPIVVRGMPEDRMQAELYAQLMSAYLTTPTMLRQQSPALFEIAEAIQNDIQSANPSPADQGSRSVQGRNQPASPKRPGAQTESRWSAVRDSGVEAVQGEGFLDDSKYFFHAVRDDATIASIMRDGLHVGSNVGRTNGQPFEDEGGTVLVFERSAYKLNSKGYQGDEVVVSGNAKPVAILKDVGPHVNEGVTEAEWDALDKEYERMQAERAKSKLGDAFWDKQEERFFRRMDEADARSTRGVTTANDVLASYFKFGVPVHQLLTDYDETTDTQEVTLAGSTDAALPREDRETVRKHFGEERWGKSAREKFLASFADWVSAGRSAAHALAGVFTRFAKATINTIVGLAVALHFSPSVITDTRAASVPLTQVTITRAIEQPKADFGDVDASKDVRMVADWRLRSGTKVPFLVAEKPTGLIYAFDAKGVLLAKAPALYGKTVGDALLAGSETKTVDQTTDAEKITPAGVFKGKGESVYGAPGVNFLKQENSFIAIHTVYLGTKSERRMERLKSDTGADNRVSYGCINATPDFVKNVLDKHFGGESEVIVLPETQQVEKFFPMMADAPTATTTTESFGGGTTDSGTDGTKGANDYGRNEKDRRQRPHLSGGIRASFSAKSALRNLYRRMHDTYDESDSPDDAYDMMYAEATPAQQSLLRALKKEEFLGFDYPHEAVWEMMNDPESYELTPELKGAVTRLVTSLNGPEGPSFEAESPFHFTRTMDIDATVRSPTQTLDDVPPALLKKVRVTVDQLHGGEVKQVEVSAQDALKDLDDEIAAYEKLLTCVRGA